MTHPVDGKLRHSRVSKILVLISGVVLFLFLFVSFFLGREVDFVVKEDFSVSSDRILPYISDLQKWREWTVWNEKYYEKSTIFPVYETNQSGETVRSIEKQVDGSQTQTIVLERKEITPDRVVFEYSFWNEDENDVPLILAASVFTLTSGVGSTRVTWQYSSDYSPLMGSNPLQKYFLFFTEFSLKRAYQESLKELKKRLEG